MPTVNRRNLVDALAQVTRALPAAAANVTSSGIYLGGQGPHRERLKLRVNIPANTVLVATKTLTLSLQDSANNSSFAATSPSQTITITGETGFAAQELFFDIPANARDYVGVNFAVETGGGDNTGTTATISLVS